MPSVWATTLTISLLSTTATVYPQTPYVSPSPLSTIMAIKTRTTSIKEKPSKAVAASVVHSTRRNTRSTSRSPKAINVNSLLANINQPKNRFEGALTILGTQDAGTDNLDDPCNLVPPEGWSIDKSNALTSINSPIGVEEGIMLPTLNDDTPSPNKQAQSVVRINDNPTPPLSRENSATPSNKLHSVLKNPSSAHADGDDPPTSRALSSGGLSLRGL